MCVSMQTLFFLWGILKSKPQKINLFLEGVRELILGKHKWFFSFPTLVTSKPSFQQLTISFSLALIKSFIFSFSIFGNLYYLWRLAHKTSILGRTTINFWMRAEETLPLNQSDCCNELMRFKLFLHWKVFASMKVNWKLVTSQFVLILFKIDDVDDEKRHRFSIKFLMYKYLMIICSSVVEANSHRMNSLKIHLYEEVYVPQLRKLFCWDISLLSRLMLLHILNAKLYSHP